MEKMTKIEKFNLVLQAVAGNDILTEFIQNEIDILSRKYAKKSENKKPTKVQQENDIIKQNILKTLNKEEFKTYADINLALGQNYSTQKLVALMKQMENLVEKGQKDKKVAYKLV